MNDQTIQMRFPKIVNVLSFLLLAHTVAAQGGIVVKTTVDKSRILIGEPIQLIIEADIPADAVIAFVRIDSIEHFEFLEKPAIDTINTNTGTIIKGKYTITSFDSGHWVIPSFVLTGNIVTDTIPVDVDFSAFDPTRDYHDIKDILEVKPEAKKSPWWWYVAGGALLLLLLLVYFLRKKKQPPAAAPLVAVDSYQDAMRQLDKLRDENPEAKQYYSRLTDIFRLYVYRKKGIHSLQKTTDDLVIQLKEIPLHKDQFDQLAQALRMGDFVKFAKYVPAKEDDKNVFDTIKKTIQDIEQLT
jgi:LPXTG-motif cell wall-anchored protein